MFAHKCHRAAALAALTAFVSAAAIMPTASAVEGTYTAVARADGVLFESIASQAPVTPDGKLLAASPNTSQAVFDSLGRSTGFASAPYPGETAATLPGLLGGFVGVPAPGYPAYVTSSYPTSPEGRMDSGPGTYSIHSRSDVDGTVARTQYAFLGQEGASTATAVRSVAHAGRETEADRIVARAHSTVDSIMVGELLSVGQVHSTATAAFDGVKVTTESSFRVDGVTLAGLPIDLADEGGLMKDGSAALDSPLEALEAAGISIELLPEREIKGGIISAGLVVSYQISVPGAGDTTVRLTIGRSMASVEGAPSVPIDFGSAPDDSSVTIDGSPEPSSSLNGERSTDPPTASTSVAPTPSGTGNGAADSSSFTPARDAAQLTPQTLDLPYLPFVAAIVLMAFITALWSGLGVRGIVISTEIRPSAQISRLRLPSSS